MKKTIFLIHGDSLCTDDIDYQKLKKVLRNPIIQFIFLHLHKNLRLKLTGQLRKKSIEAQSYKSEKIMDVNQSAVDELMTKYPNTGSYSWPYPQAKYTQNGELHSIRFRRLEKQSR